jgi:hypothetical protein
MDLLLLLSYLIVVAAALLYLIRRWKQAKADRDLYMTLRPGAGVNMDEKPVSAIPFLFK